MSDLPFEPGPRGYTDAPEFRRVVEAMKQGGGFRCNWLDRDDLIYAAQDLALRELRASAASRSVRVAELEQEVKDAVAWGNNPEHPNWEAGWQAGHKRSQSDRALKAETERDSLRLERDAAEAARIRDNEYLIGQRNKAVAALRIAEKHVPQRYRPRWAAGPEPEWNTTDREIVDAALASLDDIEDS